MSDAIKEFVEDARDVTIAAAATLLKLDFKKGGSEHPQPCPACGGVDRFSFNTVKNSWHCRGDGVGGRGAIGMAAHVLGLDVRHRRGLLDACAAVLGRPVPDEAEHESEEDRAARLERMEARRRRNEEAAARREAEQVDFREAERRKARGIYAAATNLVTSASPFGRFYLRQRGCAVPDDRWLRIDNDVTYWHGRDERGHALALHTGPAMIAPFVDATMAVIGCHITWIDLDRRPKFRPPLVDPETGEVLPTKKMRGSKKGGLLPLAGAPSARRWVSGEGIENVLAFARFDGLREDTFYCAAGDLGNLSGPAEASSRFPHPELKKADRNGVERPVMVAGPVPRRDQKADDAMWVADHVEELVLLGDGDSERVMTAAAMVRARARHARPGRLIPVVWAPPGMDFSVLLGNDDSDRD